MRLREVFVVLAFLSLVVSTYVAAGRIVVGWAWRRWTGRGHPSPRFRWFRRVVLSLAALGLVCMGYAYFIEPYRLTVTRLRLTSAKFSPGSRPIRIVHLSDLHCDAKVRLEGRIPGEVAALKPDLIVFTGDATNSIEGRANFIRCIKTLTAIAPVYAVRGNWDYKPGEERIFEEAGAIELKGSSVIIELAGNPVWLGGTTPVWLGGTTPGVGGRLQKVLHQAPHDILSIFLQHYPDQADDAAKAGVDIYLAGHTHGGQVALPFYGAMMTLSRFGKRFESGLSWVESTAVYVSRGIGMEGNISPRLRFCSPPEIVLLEIVPEGPPHTASGPVQ
jgi:hypothetical protein